MHRRIDAIVNAQVSVNRAVFEANKVERKIDEAYLADCLASAIQELATALAWITAKHRRVK